MKYAKIINNKIIQIQPYIENGFIEIPDNAYCGQVLENGIFINPPRPIETEKLIKITEAKSILAGKLTSGFNFNATGILYHYPTKPEDQIKLETAVIKNTGCKLEVRTTDSFKKRIPPDGYAEHTAEQVVAVFNEWNRIYTILKEFSGALIARIENATTLVELEAIKETVGWPV